MESIARVELSFCRDRICSSALCNMILTQYGQPISLPRLSGLKPASSMRIELVFFESILVISTAFLTSERYDHRWSSQYRRHFLIEALHCH